MSRSPQERESTAQPELPELDRDNDRRDQAVVDSARAAGEYAASVADVDPALAAPLAKGDEEALADPGQASSAPDGGAS